MTNFYGRSANTNIVLPVIFGLLYVMMAQTAVHIDSALKSCQSFKDALVIYPRSTSAGPVASFTISPNDTVCADTEIVFDAGSSTGNGLKYKWSFSNGVLDSGQVVRRVFSNTAGPDVNFITVILIVTDISGLSDIKIDTVWIKKIPDVNLQPYSDNSELIVFNSVPTFRRCETVNSYTFIFQNVSSTSANNSQYIFDWGDGSPIETKDRSWRLNDTISHEYTSTNKELSLTIVGRNGCSFTKRYNVFYGNYLGVGLEKVFSEQNYCVGDSVKFRVTGTALNSQGTIYKFSVDDGSPAQIFSHPPPNIITHYFLSPNCERSKPFFTATLTVYTPCDTTGNTKSTQQAYYVTGKSKAISRISDTILCVNSSIKIENISDYQFASENGACRNDRFKQAWKIEPGPGTYQITSGQEGSYNNGVFEQNGSTSLQVSFLTPGTYTLKLYISNGSRCGDVDSATKTVCVRENAFSGFTINGLNPINCNQDTISFNSIMGNSNNCSGLQNLWRFINLDRRCSRNLDPVVINGNLSSENIDAFFREAGIYEIKHTVSVLNVRPEVCPVSVSIDTLIIRGRPRVSIRNINPICVGTSIHPFIDTSSCFSNQPLECNWRFEGGIPDTSSQFDPGNIRYDAPGTYTVKAYARTTCGVSVSEISFEVFDKPAAFAGNDQAICSGDTAELGGTSTSGYAYEWQPVSLFNINSNTVSNPKVIFYYNGVGTDTTYELILKTSVGVNCEKTDTVRVRVKKSPKPIITTANPYSCRGDSSYIAVTGGDVYTWVPNLSIYNSSTANDTIFINPVQSTRYSVTAKFNRSDNNCSSTLDTLIHVRQGAIAKFTPFNNYNRCLPFNLNTVIQTTLYPDENLEYIWHITSANGIELSTQSNTNGAPPDFLLANLGDSVFVFLEAKGIGGCRDSISKPVKFKVSDDIFARLIKDVNSADLCTPDTVLYTMQTNPGAVVTWRFGNGNTYNGINPPQQIFSSGNGQTTFINTVTVETECATKNYRDTIILRQKPIAIPGTDTTSICSGDSILLFNSSEGYNNIYLWQFSDGTQKITNSKAPFYHTFSTGNSPVIYTVRLIALSACGADSSGYIEVVVNPNNINPNIVISGNRLTGCDSLKVTIFNSSTGAIIYEYDFGDGTPRLILQSPETVEHVYTKPGDFILKVTMKNNGCGNKTITRLIKVFPRPIPKFSAPVSLCSGKILQVLNKTSPQAPGIFYRWSWGDGSPQSTEFNPTHIYSAEGAYTIQLTSYFYDSISSAYCEGSQIDSLRIIIGQQATANFYYTPLFAQPNKPYFFNNVSANADRYKWVFGDGDSLQTYTKNPFEYVYRNSGTFNTCLYAYNKSGCNDYKCFELKALIVPLVDVPNAFTPGKFGENAVIKVKGFNIARMDWRIYNRWGQLVFTSNNVNDGWDGRYKGVIQPMEVYTYTLDVIFYTGEKFRKDGDITLLR